MALVKYSVERTVGVITVDNPPVNAVSIGVPRGVIEHLAAANHDDAVKAVVLTGAGRGFIAGADIKEFGKPRPPDEPTLRDMIGALEGSSKPVVAAIHGNALGGGLETAMGCHYRCVTEDARLGQPEVKLGLPPGAGGTQRLPRLVGMAKALQMIVVGAPISAREGFEHGLVDKLVDADLVAESIEFAEHMVAERDTHTRVRDRSIDRGAPSIFEEFRQSIEHRAGGRRAPYACIECLEAAASLPFDEGITREREIFDACMASVESQAMRHVFFAERQVAKIPDLPKETPTRPIVRAAVIGAGTMGSGIAMNFANAGIPVLLLDQEQSFLDRGLRNIEKNYASTVRKGRLTEEQMSKRLSLISPTLDIEDLREVDMVVEAVFEEMPIKLEVFKRLDEICKPGAIIASNTSYLDVNELARATSRAQDVLGTHFFSPANVMRLLEIVRTDACSREVLATVLALAKQMRKVGVISGVCNGFIGNRMLEGYLREAAFLIEEGALPKQVDRVITEFGFPMGPFAVSDLAGLDIGWRKRKADAATRDPKARYSVISDRLCEQGRFGQKTRAGYYRYESGSRVPIPDEPIETLIVEASRELGIERREIDDREILTRCLYPLINEGAQILDEGIAQRASDIDIVWINGYAFPDYRGGPMFYADTVGAAPIYDQLCRYQERHGDIWQPAPLLKRLAENGESFADL